MEKLNLPPFYVGQKVVCVSSSGSHKRGVNYVVSETLECSCGLSYTAVGVSSGMGYQFPCICGKTHPTITDHYMSFSNRFAPIQEQKFPLITLSKIQELEKEEILISN